MGGVEDNQLFDKFMDEIGLVFTKVDESIQKSIELWRELTRDIFDDQPTQDLTGKPNSGESGVEMVSQYPVAEVKERPIQHWSMRASKILESFMQELGDGDGDEEEEEDESTVSEEDSESSLKTRNGDYQLLKSVDTFPEEDDEDKEEDTTVSKSSDCILEINLGSSATSYIPSSYHRHNEEDSDSSLKWKGDYQLFKNVDIAAEEDDDGDYEFGECHSEDIEEVIEVDLSNESLVVHDDENDVWDNLQGFVDVMQEEIWNNTDFGENPRKKLGGKLKEINSPHDVNVVSTCESSDRGIAPFLKKSFGLDESTVGWDKVDDGPKKRRLEEKFKKVKAKQMELGLLRVRFVADLASVIFKEIASSELVTE